MSELDFSAHYKRADMPGVAWYLRGWTTEEVQEDDYLVCEDKDCDHALSEMCWAPGDTSIVQGDMVRAVMVGDDREHLVDPDDLIELDEDAYCAECGQIGCTHDGRDRTGD